MTTARAAAAVAAGDADDSDHESDEDFDPNAAAAAAAAAEAGDSSSDEEEGQPASKKRKKVAKDEAEALDFDNSGDEATISKSKRKKRKKGAATADEDGDESGGEGGLIKTRAQRAAEGVEKKEKLQTGKATVDVDALWAAMQGQTAAPPTREAEHTADSANNTNGTQKAVDLPQGTAPESNGDKPFAGKEEMITIRRTYEFAGEKLTEEKLVPASSAEAKLYLEQQKLEAAAQSSEKPAAPAAGPATASAPRRPKKRQSMFDASPAAMGAAGPGGTARAPKLNTLTKSRLDWAAHVDAERLGEELDSAARAKGGYLGKQDFLSRMDAKREDAVKPAPR